MSDSNNNRSEFERAAQEKREGLISELIVFLRVNRKWWMMPIIVSLLLIGVLIVAGSAGAGPFIYTLF